MPIHFSCQCGKQYRVADQHAGKRTKCKECGAALVVPAHADNATSTQHPAVEPETARPAARPAPPRREAVPPAPTQVSEEQWHVQSHDGNRYGPVSRAELDRWVAENLLTPACQIWKEGDPEWQLVSSVYPQLVTPASGEAEAHPATEPAHPAAVPARQDYEPLLSATGKKKTMGNLAIRGEVKKLPGATMLSSDVYQVGEPRSLMDRLKAGTMIGPVKVAEMSIDQLQLFHFRDASGEFAAILPFDNGGIAPIEFVAVLPGCLPSAIVLLKQSGGKVAIEAGEVIGGPLGTLLGQLGTSVESVWAGCDGSVPPAATAAQQLPALREGMRWEGKIGGGPVSTVYRISWGVQAIPLNTEQFLLVAQSVPKSKMIGLEFNVPWFCGYRSQFAQFVAGLSATGGGQFEFFDPGVWLPVSSEALGWVNW